jgi:hypothetical protein
MRFHLFVAAAFVAGPAAAGARDVSPAACVDADGDGWTDCDGDCCDGPGDCGGGAAAEVNPGAFEVPGNAADDDCDAATPDAGPDPCDAVLASNSSQPLDYARALDLCAFTVETPPLPERRWGVISAAFALANGTGTPYAASRSIRPSFGPNVGPQGGLRMAVLSSGNAAAFGQANPAWINPQEVGVDTGLTSPPPADWLAAHGGVPPVLAGCPLPVGGSTAHDPILLKLRVRVPTNARSFSFKAFAYSSEYPEFTCSPYVDYFLALLDSRSGRPGSRHPNPADKNLAVYDPAPSRRGVAHPLGVNLAVLDRGLFSQCKNGPIGCDTAHGATAGNVTTCADTTLLAGTGFDRANPRPQYAPVGEGYCGSNNLLGGGTGWWTVRGNVSPGETMELRLVLWDTGDANYDSVVLLDGFQWSVSPTSAGARP